MTAPQSQLVPNSGKLPYKSPYRVKWVYVATGVSPLMNLKLNVTTGAADVTVSPMEGSTNSLGEFEFTVTFNKASQGNTVVIEAIQVGQDGPKKDGDVLDTATYSTSTVQMNGVLVRPIYQTVTSIDNVKTVFTTVSVTPSPGALGGTIPNFSVGLDMAGNIIATDPVTTLEVGRSALDDRYYMLTGTNGTASMNVAGLTTGIVRVRAAWGDSHKQSAESYLTFLPAPGDGGGDRLPPIIEGENAGKLDLDGVDTSYITIFADPRSIDRGQPGHLPGSDMAVLVINDKGIGDPITLDELVHGIQVPKAAFKTVPGANDNTIYWMASDPTSTSGIFSAVVTVTVVGDNNNHPPTDGTLPAPTAPRGLQIINDDWLTRYGDVEFTVPVYNKIAVGDIITLNAYINAWDPLTEEVKPGLVTATSDPVADVSKPQAVSMLARQLVGFYSSPQGQPGTFELNYEVAAADGTAKGKSKPLYPSVRIATT
ncbi:hypothetical protein [Pandoraea sputorum]|uniref:Uncharacterized protein n=1 Tax=Pandoraea sputorum TaxID=93222 RepID=A0A5E5APW8_9BURK|nr:hypothetical protein [Pandoraea sputorum]VVE75769.1 hypothetical protein PSP31121_00595 [Pandoraea sputorum]